CRSVPPAARRRSRRRALPRGAEPSLRPEQHLAAARPRARYAGRRSAGRRAHRGAVRTAPALSAGVRCQSPRPDAFAGPMSPAEAPAAGRLSSRPMTTADVPDVLALERELFPQDAWPEEFVCEELAHAEPSAEPDRATRRYWVGEETAADSASSRIVAYAGIMCVLPLADVQTLAVAPAAQGRGLGSRLLRLIEAEARRRGAADLLLEVRADNPGAQRL